MRVENRKWSSPQADVLQYPQHVRFARVPPVHTGEHTDSDANVECVPSGRVCAYACVCVSACVLINQWGAFNLLSVLRAEACLVLS